MKLLRFRSHRNISYLLAVSFSVLPFVLDFDNLSNHSRVYAAESGDDPAKIGQSQAKERQNIKADKNPSSKVEVKDSSESSASTIKAESKDEVLGDSGSEVEIISITDALKQGQIQHEKNLVDKFLLGIAVIFLVIAFFLFNSLPPSSPEQGSG